MPAADHVPTAEALSTVQNRWPPGCDLAQDKTIYLWDVQTPQRRERAIEAFKDGKQKLAKEAALALRGAARHCGANGSFKIY